MKPKTVSSLLSGGGSLAEIGRIPRKPWWTEKKKDCIIGFFFVIAVLTALFFAPG